MEGFNLDVFNSSSQNQIISSIAQRKQKNLVLIWLQDQKQAHYYESLQHQNQIAKY